MIRTLAEANAALLPFVPLVGQLTHKDTTLLRIKPLMRLLGNPEDRLTVVHIAGTSGKTSTSYYMAALLRASGKKVGLTVSPHIDSVAERVQINAEPLDQKTFCKLLDEFLEIVNTTDNKPSYFELLYAFALWVFDIQNVDYAVVETGMGGLHDATNVTTRPDKVCIITDIGFDHTHLLGKTLAEITHQKIGIVHPGNQVFMYNQAEEIMEVAQKWINDHHATLHTVDEPQVVSLEMPDYQKRNWWLAYCAYEYLQKRDKLKHLTSQTLDKTQHITIPARMDIVHINGKKIVMDGAHNSQKMEVFVQSFKKLFPDTKPTILVSVKAGKQYQEIVPQLARLGSRIITTTFKTTQDLPVVSMDSSVLAKALIDAGANNVGSISDSHDAFRALLDDDNTLCLITGSFYLISQIRNTEHIA